MFTIRKIRYRKLRSAALAGVLLAGFAAGCDDDDGNGSGGGPAEIPEIAPSAMEAYANIVHASYEDSLASARALDVTIDALIATPNADTLEAARQAWLASREPYLQTEVYRFYDGPIDNPEDGPEGLLNAWPLDEAYIDYVQDNATAGIVNNTEIAITGDQLMALNEEGAEENISTGYHAIEFLLWGQDLDDNGPGARPFTDYLTDGMGTAENQDRRATYLKTASTLMLGNLEDLVAAWAPGVDNYRAEFVGADAREGLRRVLTGMIILSGFETGGERLQTALDSGDQEDEHSCFSDNTHRDMVQDVRGVSNVYFGSYSRLDNSMVGGSGIRDIVRAANPDLAARLETEIKASLAAAEALQPPFDQELQTDAGRARIQTLIDALRTQEDSLEEVFTLFGLSIPVAE